MKLELYLDGAFYESMDIGTSEATPGCSLYHKSVLNEDHVLAHTLQMKAIYFRQIGRSRHYSIYLVAESRANKLIADTNKMNHLQTNNYETTTHNPTAAARSRDGANIAYDGRRSQRREARL